MPVRYGIVAARWKMPKYVPAWQVAIYTDDDLPTDTVEVSMNDGSLDTRLVNYLTPIWVDELYA